MLQWVVGFGDKEQALTGGMKDINVEILVQYSSSIMQYM